VVSSGPVGSSTIPAKSAGRGRGEHQSRSKIGFLRFYRKSWKLQGGLPILVLRNHVGRFLCQSHRGFKSGSSSFSLSPSLPFPQSHRRLKSGSSTFSLSPSVPSLSESSRVHVRLLFLLTTTSCALFVRVIVGSIQAPLPSHYHLLLPSLSESSRFGPGSSSFSLPPHVPSLSESSWVRTGSSSFKIFSLLPSVSSEIALKRGFGN
jgi:hypothetical protein